jgi:MarR family transcriptional regulator, organic hydroperoxide resistance regulator
MADSYDHLALDRQLCFALYAASRAVTRNYAPILDDVGLTYPQYVALLALWERPADPMTVGELGRRLRLETGTLTPLLKRLDALGHVRRIRDTVDERRVLVELTDQGTALRDQMVSVPETLVRASGLTLTEVIELRERLVDALDAARPDDRD